MTDIDWRHRAEQAESSLSAALAERDGLDFLLKHSDAALVKICKALNVPLDWHAEPFPAEEEVLAAIAAALAQVTALKEENQQKDSIIIDLRKVLFEERERLRVLTAERETLRAALDELERHERERLAESLKLPYNLRMHEIKSAKLEAYAEIRAVLSSPPATEPQP